MITLEHSVSAAKGQSELHNQTGKLKEGINLIDALLGRGLLSACLLGCNVDTDLFLNRGK